MPAAPVPSNGAIRSRLVETLRRDLVGPSLEDADIARELLKNSPSRWYLTGYLAPALEDIPEGAENIEDEGDPHFSDEPADPETGTGGGRAADDPADDEPSARKSRLPSSCGLTVLIDASVKEVEVSLNWGDYVTVPPLPDEVFLDEKKQFDPAFRNVQWQRVPGEATLRLPVPNGRGRRVIVPGSAGVQRPGGALYLEAHARPYVLDQPDGSTRNVMALTVTVVNRRSSTRRRFIDVSFAFQVRLEVRSAPGLYPRANVTGYASSDLDAALADLHYCDVADYAVGCNTSAGWEPDEDGVVRAAYTDFLPAAEVERVEPNEDIGGVEFGMEALAALAASGPEALRDALRQLPAHYEDWIIEQQATIATIQGVPRQATAQRLVAAARQARDRLAEGIALLSGDQHARLAFRAMNEAVARAARQRDAGQGGDPLAQRVPKWRPFQLAFILLNLSGLQDRLHPDREVVDLLFFPTGGGKTEAYLGLAAWTIAHRRITNGGTLGAGVAVLMRYTLRLLTLDQLARASGVICALELMRGEPAWLEGDKRTLGDWPIEIGLWVGSAASPNRLGKTGDGRKDTAVARVRRFRRDGREAPAPIKACPWCSTPFSQDSFACIPTVNAPRNMEIRCANPGCAFSGTRSLPILTVDEVIYRRLPAFIIATVDKFAGLPWLAEAGAFFGHVDREDQWGFYGAADPSGSGTRLYGGGTLAPPALIIQDELHLISGPLGTVAALYEVALDRLATRVLGDKQVRPKIVASTATVRRAGQQIKALFDRDRTEVFPPPGLSRRNSFFAVTVPPSQKPARLYVGMAAPGKGPKLIFLRALTTLLAAAEKQAQDGGDAEAYLTALCYFNALRELGGARRIVEDEVRAKLATYGTDRRRITPPDEPFADRRLRDVMELTSRESTDKVAAAKDALAKPCADPKQGVDVALATNMISVGLDIGRLGLMVVQGQPKSAAEYIQATSRVGRQADKPGLVLVLLNAHKARDRLHYEGFRHFHECFYRAVEATSVTPWAARAMDRALAPVLVAAARHLIPALTPDAGAGDIADYKTARATILKMMLDRAPAADVVGGHTALRDAVERLIDAWEALANDKRANAEHLYYGYPREKALLHDPLDPLLGTLDPDYRKFTAGRSMRDVEHASVLKVTDPYGQSLG
ncbi:DISARM system helicase DrmA [Bradyrhizobium pachyrhizi]|uniref:DISARM system helicase DrmA n=1 Tax=Bradyrhizobium pachyrhizi TaxID=280333 RepID=UPI0024B18519|nr:DISARM system helicase DrmA [Bradyrhizobium pachyrhizi]WFU56823.1 DISARM system helicase DrmA [Bradyrhizobium pachyrhizi]